MNNKYPRVGLEYIARRGPQVYRARPDLRVGCARARARAMWAGPELGAPRWAPMVWSFACSASLCVPAALDARGERTNSGRWVSMGTAIVFYEVVGYLECVWVWLICVLIC